MASIQHSLQNWASRNGELVQILSDTDYAPTALEQQKAYINDLNRELAKNKTDVQNAERKRTKEEHEHKAYNESIMKRFTYKAVGKREKFNEKAAKEEREYLDALQDEHNAKERTRYLQQQLSEATGAIGNLENVAKQNKDAQEQLDALYNSIFSGPTPELPQEDRAEQEVSMKIQIYRGTRSKWESEDQALRILGEAERNFQQALTAIGSSLDYSTWDVWGGGTMTDMMERNELSRAQSLVSTAYMLHSQAQRFSQLPDLNRVDIDQGHIMSDVIFDNIFSDLAQHDRIKSSKAMMDRGYSQLVTNKRDCAARVDALRAQLNQEEQAILAARKELQTIRQQAFKDLADAPPAYS